MHELFWMYLIERDRLCVCMHIMLTVLDSPSRFCSPFADEHRQVEEGIPHESIVRASYGRERQAGATIGSHV